MAEWPKSLWVIGCGNMGGAILSRWLDSGLPHDAVTVVDPKPGALPDGVRCIDAVPADVGAADMLLLAIKPQMLGDVAPSLAPLLTGNSQLISILAGTTVATLRDYFPAVGRVLRIMPNMAVGVGKAPILIADDASLDDGDKAAAEALFAPLGESFWLAEEQMGLATALAGCGPAFLFRFIDTLAGAAAELGLDPSQAAQMALLTVEGAAELAAASDVDPGTLADRVASPGGVTREGLSVIDADDRMLRLMVDVLRAARDRDIELSGG